jgi:hypothetical protein
MKLAVDVISDVICPWCFIGKRRLEKAIAAIDGQQEVQVHWHPFQLNPTMPKEGISRKEYRTRKFGSWERSLELDAKVIAVGQTEGINFAFDKIERTPNTVDAHRLIWLTNCVAVFSKLKVIERPASEVTYGQWTHRWARRHVLVLNIAHQLRIRLQFGKSRHTFSKVGTHLLNVDVGSVYRVEPVFDQHLNIFDISRKRLSGAPLWNLGTEIG